jgi:hypothetical protein
VCLEMSQTHLCLFQKPNNGLVDAIFDLKNKHKKIITSSGIGLTKQQPGYLMSIFGLLSIPF